MIKVQFEMEGFYQPPSASANPRVRVQEAALSPDTVTANNSAKKFFFYFHKSFKKHMVIMEKGKYKHEGGCRSKTAAQHRYFRTLLRMQEDGLAMKKMFSLTAQF